MAGIRCLASPGDFLLCEEQTYTGVLRIADQFGLKPYGVAMDQEGMSPEALDEALVSTNAKVVVVTPTLQNPTGRTMSDNRRKAIAEVCRQRDAYIIEDAINMPLAGTEESPLSVYARDRAIFLIGFSKCVASGMRLGLASVPDTLQGRFHEMLVATGWILPTLYSSIVTQLIETEKIDECIKRHRKEALVRLALAAQAFGTELISEASPSYHTWVDLPSHWQIDNLVHHAFAQGVYITSSQHFCCPNIETPRNVRICLGAEGNRETLEAGLLRLAALMKEPGYLLRTVI